MILTQVNGRESRQRPTTQRRGEYSTACICDVAFAEVEDLKRLEHACHGLGDQGGQARVTDLVACEHVELLERWRLAQRRRQCQQTVVPDLVHVEVERPYHGQRPFGEGGGEGGGGLISDLCRGEVKEMERGQTAAA
eukprot:scaffold97652_cov66-Phaeocystis_antarctica.AAC.4